MALSIGITGGIGSGKTTVCKLFEALNIPVYYADDRAKHLMVSNEQLIGQIKDVFGDSVYHEDGQLNRALLGQIVFSDKTKLAQLNAIVHPAVAEDGINWIKANQDSPYVLKEAALLFESDSYKSLDQIVVVTAPEELRISRVMQRDNVEEDAVKARIDKQWPQEDKVKLADHLIVNDGSQALIPQVWALHQHFLKIINDDSK